MIQLRHVLLGFFVLDVFGHDDDSLDMNSTQVSVFKKTDQVGFTGFLEGHDGWALETKIILGRLHKLISGMGVFWSRVQCSFGIFWFTKSYNSWPVSVWFLDTPVALGGLLRAALVANCFLWAFSPVDLSGLLCTSHCVILTENEFSEGIMFNLLIPCICAICSVLFSGIFLHRLEHSNFHWIKAQ